MKAAILGGKPVREKPFPAYVTVGEEEKRAAARVIDSGVLSRYLGVWHEQFLGGPEVRALEREWAEHYGVKYAVAVNSATSGLIAAVGAAGIEPGDEVIVGPWSMCISATAPLFYGGIPVFADVEPDCFCLDPAAVERQISPRTRAVIVVDLFGQPYDAPAINALAAKHGLTVIEDAAQAPGASLNGRPAGTLGQMGVFSLNYHKHIHGGEGGVVVTDDENLAERLRLIRNHAEAVVENKGVADLGNMLGFNFRMTELDAAVARCQLLKLKALNQKRLANVAYLEKGLAEIPALARPRVRPGGEHVYYVHACRYDEEAAGLPAARFVEALKAELPPFELREKEGTKLGVGYVKPLYLLPLFRERIAFGRQGWPFTLAPERRYEKGLCPDCEKLYGGGVLTHEFMLPSLEQSDLDDVIEAFGKVWKLRATLL
ncbi:MAG: DegT/DnrJ/EryC1/StrS family aminotransferase [Candidatus Adiutrix sp.]|jgi:dTDP-4-amino-4,6-dideoxygalactose transaminase|nr:DegT/DnrJ/EryC1/StrS family aminotransferase [Candidatus Adiutrix sp.]